MAAALVAKLLAVAPAQVPLQFSAATPQTTQPAEPQATFITDMVSCVAVDKREAHSPYHVVACVDVVFSGDVTGMVLNKIGRVMCSFDGAYDGACVTIAGCGVYRTYC